jgi:hypothetical protein
MPRTVDRRDVLRTLAQLAVLALPLGRTRLLAADATAADGVELQPLLAQTRRLIEAMRSLGEPFPDADVAALTAAENASDPAVVLAALDRLPGAASPRSGSTRKPGCRSCVGPPTPASSSRAGARSS